jgi:hypothetical protein
MRLYCRSLVDMQRGMPDTGSVLISEQLKPDLIWVYKHLAVPCSTAVTLKPLKPCLQLFPGWECVTEMWGNLSQAFRTRGSGDGTEHTNYMELFGGFNLFMPWGERHYLVCHADHSHTA